MDKLKMTKNAEHALYAAQHRAIWGRNAAMLYAQHHGVTRLYRLASQLIASSKQEFAK